MRGMHNIRWIRLENHCGDVGECTNDYTEENTVLDGLCHDGRVSTLHTVDGTDCSNRNCDTLWTDELTNSTAGQVQQHALAFVQR